MGRNRLKGLNPRLGETIRALVVQVKSLKNAVGLS